MTLRPLLLAVLALLLLGGCASQEPPRLAGHLILIGGALEESNADVFRRLTRPEGVLVIATAASGDEPAAFDGMVKRVRTYAPDQTILTVGRTTPTADAVAAIDRAGTVFFTGGDQKRITDLYRPGGVDRPEAQALRRLLARGGTIAGTSAGDAMMSDPMFLTGGSAAALGIARPGSEKADADGNDPAPTLGPQIGTGMGFLPKGWAIADSHFAQRNRIGRLVAALEVAGVRYGLGVSENAAVEVDLATGRVVGLTEAPSVLVDAGRAGGVKRGGPTGLDRTNAAFAVLQRGQGFGLGAGGSKPGPAVPPAPGYVRTLTVPGPEAGRDRASGFEVLAGALPGSYAYLAAGEQSAAAVEFDGYRLIAWPLEPAAPPGPGDLLWLGLEIRVDAPATR